MRLYFVLFLFPLAFAGNSSLWSIQNQLLMTENQAAAYKQLITKKQALHDLLTANNLTIADLSQAQQDTLTAMELTLAQNQPNTILEDDDDIGKNDFINDFKQHISQYLSELGGHLAEPTPIKGKSFKDYLSTQMSVDVYDINKTLYTQVIKDIPDGSTTKGNIATIMTTNLNFYLKSDGAEIKNLTKRLHKKYPELKKVKTLNGILPDKATFIRALSSDLAEDKMDLHHEEMKLYVTKLNDWSNDLSSFWINYSIQGGYRNNQILTGRLAKQLQKQLTEDAYFVAMALEYKKALSSMEGSVRCTEVCRLLATVTQNYATLNNIRQQYDAVKYKDSLYLNCSIDENVYNNSLGVALSEEVENEPDYASFQKDLKQAIDLFIKDFQLSDANLSEALIDMPSFQKHILTVSNGQVAPLVTKKLLTLKTDQSLPQTGAIVEAIKKQANALRQENALYEAWKENKLNFPIAAQYIDAVQKSVVQVDKGTFADAFQQWKNKVEGIKFAKNWTLDKSKLDKELQRVFTAAHGSFDAGGFLYSQALTPLLTGLKGQTLKVNSNDNTTDNDQTFSTIWKTMFEKCDSTLLENAYEAYKTKTSSAKELENYVSVLDSVFPDTKTIEIALSCSRHFTYVPKTGASLYAKAVINSSDSANTDSIELEFTLPMHYQAFEIDGRSLFLPIAQQGAISFSPTTTGRYSIESSKSIQVCNIESVSDGSNILLYSVILPLIIKDDTSNSFSVENSYSGGTSTAGGSISFEPLGVGGSGEGSFTTGSYSNGTSTGESRGAGGSYSVIVRLDLVVEKSLEVGIVGTRVFNYNFGAIMGTDAQTMGLNITGQPQPSKTISLPYQEVSEK